MFSRAAHGIFSKENLIGRAGVIGHVLFENLAAIKFQPQQRHWRLRIPAQRGERRQRDAQRVAGARRKRDPLRDRAAEAPVVIEKSGGRGVEVSDAEKVGLAGDSGGDEWFHAAGKAHGEGHVQREFARERRQVARDAREHQHGEGRKTYAPAERAAGGAGGCRRGGTHGARVGRTWKKISTRWRSCW